MLLVFRLITESALFALNALRENKLRTFLSLLGISIGIFTIITVFTAVEALENNLRGSVQKLGSSAIYVQKWPWAFGGDYPWWKYFNRPVPSYADFNELQNRVPDAEAMNFNISISSKNVKYRSNTLENVSIIATSHDFDKTRELELAQGRYFSALESRTGRNYAIIGDAVAVGLFGNQSPIGKNIKVQGRQVVVVGVAIKEGEDILGSSLDNSVIIPINYARNLIDIRSDRYDPQIIVKAKTSISLDQLENELRGAMRSVRRLSPKEEDNFALNQSSLLSKNLEGLFGVVNFAGAIIGGFSIIVGGFGIANIMFVSVKERTHIIGIQKSLGAKNYFILLQFLAEAVVLCIMGGAVGLFGVFLMTLAANSIFDFSFALSTSNIITGIFISVGIGLISGFVPAFVAARLNPVDAIRSK